MRTVTLAQLRQDIQNQADIAGLTARHGATLLNRLTNQSIQRFRERISGEGARHFLTVATGTMLTGATPGFPFYSLNAGAISSGIVRVYGVDVKTQGGAWKRLEHTTFEDRTSFGGGHPASIGEPRVWAEYQTTKLAIMPPPDRPYEFVVWYLPQLNDLQSDAATFDGVSGWEDYVVWDVVCRIIVQGRARANALAIDAAARDLHALHALDPSRAADERGCDPAGQAHDECSDRRRAQAAHRESRNQPRDDPQRDAVHDQNEQAQRHHGERQREDENDRPDHSVDDAEQQRRDDQCTGTGDRNAGKE